MACICTHLISGASEVSLIPRPEDRTRLLGSSLRSFSGPPSFLSLFCTGMPGGSWELEATSVSLGYLSSCSSSTTCFLFMSWVYSASAVFGLLFQQGRALSRAFLRFSSRLLCCWRGLLREHNCAISTTPKASLRELQYQLPLRFALETLL